MKSLFSTEIFSAQASPRAILLSAIASILFIALLTLYHLPKPIDCLGLDPPIPTHAGEIPFVIDMTALEGHPFLSRDEALTTILVAAETWNSGSNAGWFRYAGEVHDFTRDEQCAPGAPNLIVFRKFGEPPCTGGLWAQVLNYCKGDAWEMSICLEKPDGIPIEITTGHSEVDEADFLETIVHEFSHALDLFHSHPRAGVAARRLTRTDPAMRKRDLYDYDRRCVTKRPGHRKTHLRAFQHSADSQNLEEIPLQLSPDHGAHAVYLADDQPIYALPLSRWDLLKKVQKLWHPKFARPLFDAGSYGPPPTVHHDPNDPNTLTIYYGQEISPDPDETPLQNVYQIFSDTIDLTHPTSETTPKPLQHCTDSSDSCAPTPVQSAYPIQLATLGDSERQLFLWTHQNRRSDEEDRQLRLAVQLKPDLLSVPIQLPIQTSLSPQLTCLTPERPTHHHRCFVAFIDLADPLFHVSIQEFLVESTSDAQTPVIELLDEPRTLPLQTITSPAFWVYNNHFWLALKSPDANIRIFNSADTKTWTEEQNLGFSITAPLLSKQVGAQDFTTLLLSTGARER